MVIVVETDSSLVKDIIIAAVFWGKPVSGEKITVDVEPEAGFTNLMSAGSKVLETTVDAL